MARKPVGSDPISSVKPPVTLPPTEIGELANDPLLDNYRELQKQFKKVYEEGVSLEDAERLAARFLDALADLGGPDGQIRTADLDARMKKNGYKTMRAKVYLETVQGQEKKPTEAMIDALICTNAGVATAQDLYEKAEVYAESLHRIYDVFRDAHIYFRGIAKGAFNGS